MKAHPTPKDVPAKLVLYVSADHPTETDKKAESAIMAFDPNVVIERVNSLTEISTPRLAAGRSYYRGLDSIRAFIEQEKVQQQIRERA